MQQLVYSFILRYFCYSFYFIKLPGSELYEKVQITPNSSVMGQNINKYAQFVEGVKQKKRKIICLLNGKDDHTDSGAPLCQGT